eukprot:11173788-Lingulodinium_polyedra.AAC.1
MRLHPTKTVAVASTPHARKMLRAALQAVPEPPPIRATAKHLGLDVLWASRGWTVQAGRIATAACRARRVASLPGVPRFRAAAAAALLLAGGEYGMAVQGFTKGRLGRLRRAVHAALLGKHPGRRAVEADLHLHESGRALDPAVRAPLLALKAWSRALRRRGVLDADMHEAWQRALLQRCRTVGPVATTLAALQRAGWIPAAADLWVSRAGVRVQALHQHPLSELAGNDLVEHEFAA